MSSVRLCSLAVVYIPSAGEPHPRQPLPGMPPVSPVHPHHVDHDAGVTLPLDPVFALVLPVTPRFRDTCISKLS